LQHDNNIKLFETIYLSVRFPYRYNLCLAMVPTVDKLHWFDFLIITKEHLPSHSNDSLNVLCVLTVTKSEMASR